MLNIQYIRENLEESKQGLVKKHADPALLDTLIQFDDRRKELIQETESLRAAKNEWTNKIKSLQGDEKMEAVAKSKEIGAQLKEIEPKLEQLQEEMNIHHLSIPNPAHTSVPEGDDDEDNSVVTTWGDKPEFSFTPREHWEMAEMHGNIDFERGAKVSGSRFCFLKGDIVQLQFALVQYALSVISTEGFEMMIPPMMVNKQTVLGTGYLNSVGEDDEAYAVNPGKDDMYMVATSEASIISYHRDEILEEEKFYVGYSSCFRREAGSGGKDIRGLIRQHQFDKVEMIAFTSPETSYDHLERIRQIEEKLLQGLGIPYQLVNVCGGDLGGPPAKKYDIEAWLPGQNAYREVTSNSNITEYHSRRLNMRIRDEEGKPQYCHTLSATGLPIGRTLVAIMENYQNEDGTFNIPEVLQTYM
ncbi:MAG: serine--tRNA ligase [Patescibacteria group bacterium]|nr:serine--tRNA ligase [Patescibacteria group bacterium]